MDEWQPYAVEIPQESVPRLQQDTLHFGVMRVVLDIGDGFVRLGTAGHYGGGWWVTNAHVLRDIDDACRAEFQYAPKSVATVQQVLIFGHDIGNQHDVRLVGLEHIDLVLVKFVESLEVQDSARLRAIDEAKPGNNVQVRHFGQNNNFSFGVSNGLKQTALPGTPPTFEHSAATSFGSSGAPVFVAGTNEFCGMTFAGIPNQPTRNLAFSYDGKTGLRVILGQEPSCISACADSFVRLQRLYESTDHFDDEICENFQDHLEALQAAVTSCADTHALSIQYYDRRILGGLSMGCERIKPMSVFYPLCALCAITLPIAAVCLWKHQEIIALLIIFAVILTVIFIIKFQERVLPSRFGYVPFTKKLIKYSTRIKNRKFYPGEKLISVNNLRIAINDSKGRGVQELSKHMDKSTSVIECGPHKHGSDPKMRVTLRVNSYQYGRRRQRNDTWHVHIVARNGKFVVTDATSGRARRAR